MSSHPGQSEGAAHASALGLHDSGYLPGTVAYVATVPSARLPRWQRRMPLRHRAVALAVIPFRAQVQTKLFLRREARRVAGGAQLMTVSALQMCPSSARTASWAQYHADPASRGSNS